jgi:hypothetical protein
MSWSVILEGFVGEGSLVASQLPVIERFETEPMCAEMLARFIAYMDQPVFRAAKNRLAILGPSTEGLVKQLRNIGADFETVRSLDSRWPVTLLDLNAMKDVPDPILLRTYMENGGVVLVHRLRPEHQAWIEKVAGKTVHIAVQPYQGWVDRQMLERRDGLVTGMNNLDLYWRSLVEGGGYNSTAQVSGGVTLGKERGQTLYVVRIDGVKDYLFPGGLLEVPVGRGRLVIDQLKWELSSKDMLCGSPSRVISILLGNLGLRQKEAVPKPVMPAGVKYEPIDISPFANLPLADEKAGDGEGWCDLGSAADMRGFPTGSVRLKGVPFAVPAGAKNALCLRVSSAWIGALSKFPESISIPVRKAQVAGLVFLHTGGWTQGTECFGRREIEYADGTKEIIRLDGSNMADWNYGRDEFFDEEGTATVVAWKGANGQYPTVRVYMTTWLNPHPDKEIRQVTLSNTGVGESQWSFIPHLGLTAAVFPSGGAPVSQKAAGPGSRRDPARSSALFKEAGTLSEAGKDKDAVARLEEALKADDSNTGAWMALSALHAKTSTVDEFKALFTRWTKAEPNNYQAYNALGRFLEEQKLDAEAIAAYKRSLEIEWNQPFIMQAAERLDKKLKPGEK